MIWEMTSLLEPFKTLCEFCQVESKSRNIEHGLGLTLHAVGKFLTRDIFERDKLEAKMENRKYPRLVIKNLSVDVSDGIGFSSGVVSDFSRFGLCMTGLSNRLNGNVRNMTAIISVFEKHFKLNIQPRWSAKDRLSKTIGAEIVNAPWNWTEFTINLEP